MIKKIGKIKCVVAGLLLVMMAAPQATSVANASAKTGLQQAAVEKDINQNVELMPKPDLVPYPH